MLQSDEEVYRNLEYKDVLPAYRLTLRQPSIPSSTVKNATVSCTRFSTHK